MKDSRTKVLIVALNATILRFMQIEYLTFRISELSDLGDSYVS